MVTVVDKGNYLVGIMTDGDLRRLLTKGVDIYSEKVSEVMTRDPVYVIDTELAVNALNMMKEKNIVSMPVVDKNGYVKGGITLNHIIGAGILV